MKKKEATKKGERGESKDLFARELRTKRAGKLKLIHALLKKGMTHDDFFNCLADAWNDNEKLSAVNKELCDKLKQSQRVLNIFSEEIRGFIKTDINHVRLNILKMYEDMDDMVAKALLKGIKIQLSNSKISAGISGANKRHEPMRNLKEWAIAEYRAEVWPSANKAAHELKSRVIEHGKTINAILTKENAQRTIAEWFRKSV